MARQSTLRGAGSQRDGLRSSASPASTAGASPPAGRGAVTPQTVHPSAAGLGEQSRVESASSAPVAEAVALVPIALTIPFENEESKPRASWTFTRPGVDHHQFGLDMHHQVGGPTRAGTYDMLVLGTPIRDKFDALLEQFLVDSDPAFPDAPLKFRTPSDRYANPGLLSQCHGAIMVVQLHLSPDTLSKPFVIITDRPLTPMVPAAQGALSVSPEQIGVTDVWSPGQFPVEANKDLHLMLFSLIKDTRSRTPVELAAALSEDADSIWITTKGTRVGLTCQGLDFLPTPVEGETLHGLHRTLWLSVDQAKQGMVQTAFADQLTPPCVQASNHPAPNGAWVLSAILPLPTYHCLPFGYGMEVSDELTAVSFIRGMRAWAGAGDQENLGAWLLTDYVEAWFEVVRRNPAVFAIEVMPLSQCRGSLSALVTDPTVAKAMSPATQLYVSGLRASVLHHFNWDRFIWSAGSKALATRALGYGAVAAAAIDGHPDLTLGTSDPACHSDLWALAEPPTPGWKNSLDIHAIRKVLPLRFGTQSFAQFRVTTEAIRDNLVPVLQTVEDLVDSSSPDRSVADQQASDQAASTDAIRRLFASTTAGGSLKQATPQTTLKDPPVVTHGPTLPPKVLDFSSGRAGVASNIFPPHTRLSTSTASAPKSSSAVLPLPPTGIYQVPWVHAEDVHHSSAKSGWNIGIDIGPFSWSNDMHAFLPQARSDPHLTPDQVKHRFDRGSYVNSVGPANSYMLSLMASYRLNHGHSGSEEHLVLVVPEKHQFWPFDWLLMPLLLAPIWISNVLLAAADKGDAMMATNRVAAYLESRMRQEIEIHILHRQHFGFPCSPLFRPGFFKHCLSLVMGLRQASLDDGLDLATSRDHNLPESVTVWHFLGSLESAADGLMPLRGLSIYDVLQLLVNILTLLDVMFYDTVAYPDLPPGHGSPFLLSSPLAGAFLHAIFTLKSPVLNQVWSRVFADPLYPTGTQPHVKALLFHLGDFIRRYKEWMNLCGTATRDIGVATTTSTVAADGEPSYERLSVIHTERRTAKEHLSAIGQSWCDDFNVLFSLSSLQAIPPGKMAYSLPLPICVTSPPAAAGGGSKPGGDSAPAGAKRGKRQSDNPPAGDDSRKRAATRAAQPPGSAPEGKSASVPMFVWVNDATRPRNTFDFGIWLKQWQKSEAHQNVRIPTVRGEQFCFSFLTRSCRCTTRNCRLRHDDYLAPPASDYTKADFRLVADWLKISSIALVLQLTEEGKAFMAKLAA